MINPITFVGGDSGTWKVTAQTTLVGDPLAGVGFVEAHEAHDAPASAWALRGTNNHTRYSAKVEVEAMRARQEGLGRSHATCAALIPVRKSAAWWALAQDERRRVFEEESHHIGQSMPYLPAIARRLYHSRDLGEPFDFLTWFEFAPEHSADFDTLLVKLRATREWDYVDREVDIRLVRD